MSGSASRRRQEAGSHATVVHPHIPDRNLGREGFFYVGGQYVGPPGKEAMHGSMYVEVWVPKQIRQRYPVVFFLVAGQTGTV
jgi:hypothetical protein